MSPVRFFGDEGTNFEAVIAIASSIAYLGEPVPPASDFLFRFGTRGDVLFASFACPVPFFSLAGLLTSSDFSPREF